MKPGDLVRVIADNCDCGIGLLVAIDDTLAGEAHRVLTRDGRCLYYFPFELHEIGEREDEAHP